MTDATPITNEDLSFISGGRRIAVQAWRNELPSSPAIVVLHGAGGMDAGHRYIAQLARTVAPYGFHTFLVEYFDRTGTEYANETTIKTHGPAWLETIHDAVDYIAALPGVDADCIGTFGYSLGGYLAVAHAAQDERIRAVVELAGGIDAETAASATRLPPLLIVHGREDQRVSINSGMELQRIAQKLRTPVQTLFLPGERHLLSPGATLVAVRQALLFYDAHLKHCAALV
ncbi:MAG: dienelactone hydrolase family protein [Chthoniobacter sp.]|uniref:dienelactone hydrolase family protein n=1 Tax=Chthoniobacter sp. TaxID=2510640 RepID=UPI0032A307B2